MTPQKFAVLMLLLVSTLPALSNAQTRNPLWHNISRLSPGVTIDDRRVQIYVDVNPSVQRLYVLIDGVQIPDKDGRLDWKISSGTPSHRTPTGIFSLDNRWYHATSQKYDNAPMPFAQFFSGGKIGMHGTSAVGMLGRVASHGCVRLHTQNAKRLFFMVENVLIDDCANAGIPANICPLRNSQFQQNPTRNVGVALYDSRNAGTMYGISPNLPWLNSSRLAPVPAPAPIPQYQAPVTQDQLDRALEEDRAFEEEDRRRTQELNRRYNEQILRQMNQGQIQYGPTT